MPKIVIGPCRIADATGTHEPGAVIDNPGQDLIDLAESKATDPESGLAYATVAATPAPAHAPAPAVVADKAPS